MSKVVYHGSPNGDIETFKPNVSTHQVDCVYATDNKTIALLYMSRSNGDIDTSIEIKDGKVILVERRAGVLDNIYNKSGYLYELDCESFNHYDFLWEAEVISYEKNLKPIRKTYYENILKEIEKAELSGGIIIYRYPNRPKEIPLDNSDLIDKYLSFAKMGHKGSVDTLLMFYPELKEQTLSKMEMPETLYCIVKDSSNLDNIVAYDNVLDTICNSKMGESDYDGVFKREEGYINYQIRDGKLDFSKGSFNMDEVFYLCTITGEKERLSESSFKVNNVKIESITPLDLSNYLYSPNLSQNKKHN